MSVLTGESSGRTSAESVAIRPPRLEDFSKIVEIANWATCHTAANFKLQPETVDEWVTLWKGAGEQYPWLVAESDGAVIGFAMASPFKGRCGYAYSAEVTVYVAPDNHGKGAGHALYGRLIPTLKAQGYKTLIAVIAIPNPASERLHARFNFKKVGVLERVGWKFGRWHDVAYWQLIVNEGRDDPNVIKTVCEVQVSPEANA